MPVVVGDAAPLFSLFAHDKSAWSLSAYRGKKVVLLFFPAAFTGTCTTELNAVSHELARFNDANAVVVGISTDSPFVLAEFKAANEFGFSLLSDHDATVAAIYGVKFDQDFTAMKLDRIAKRAVFVVDEHGRVVHREVVANPGHEPDYDAILGSIETPA